MYWRFDVRIGGQEELRPRALELSASELPGLGAPDIFVPFDHSIG